LLNQTSSRLGGFSGTVLRIGIWREERFNQPLGSKPIIRLKLGNRRKSATRKRPAGECEFIPAVRGGCRVSVNN